MTQKRRKILIFSISISMVLALTILSAIGIFINKQGKKEVRNVSQIYMSGLSSQMTYQLNTVMNMYFTRAESLCTLEVDSLDDMDEVRNYVERVNKVFDFRSIALISKDGDLEMLCGESFSVGLSPQLNKSFIETNASGKRKAAAGDIATDGSRMILFGVPAKYYMKNGETSVALVTAVPADHFLHILNMDVDSEIIDLNIINGEGNFVIRGAVSDTPNYYEYLRRTDVTDPVALEKHIEALAEAIKAKKDYGAQLTHKTEEQYVFCKAVPESEWFLITVLPYGVLTKTVDTINHQNTKVEIFGLILILVIFAALFAVYLRINSQQVAEIETARAAAVAASKAKSEFLSNMSHDIRTPMNAIQGMTAIAQTHIENTEQVRHCLAKISMSGRHLLGLINDILDMSKIESGKMTLNEERTSLRDVMDSIVTIAQPQMKAKNQKFEVSIRNITSEFVFCDSVRFNQVLLNLMSNAIKFTPDGGTISISMRQDQSQKGDEWVSVKVNVRDTGIGMAPEFKDTIWDAFSREDNSRVHKIQGSGLGMAITKYIVEKMQGTIDFDSELGKGTEFHVCMDMKKAPGVDNEVMKFPGGGDVLLVDDDVELCESATEALSSFGLNVETTLDGESAIDLAMERHRKGNDYRVILMDWMLPGMDGIEAVWQIRNQIGTEVPIILITAYDWMEFEDEARKAGISGFISKPLFRSTLYHGLKPFLDAKEGEQDAEQTSEFPLGNRKILLAEDMEVNAEVAKMLLSDFGITIDWAENGALAVEKFSEMPEGYYDAILMDIRMPVMNGYEAAEKIRASQRSDSNIPIIAMTADAFSEDVKKCLEVGMNAHVSKPIDIKKLLQQLEEHLPKKE